MVIFGNDPGCSGAIIAHHYLTDTFATIPMPTKQLDSATRVDGLSVRNFIVEQASPYAHSDIHVYIERVGAARIQGRQQGGTSMFTFGHAAGLLQGVYEGLGLTPTLVMPQVWKRHVGLLCTEKDASRLLCLQYFPQLAHILQKKGKGQAISDALLIAKYGLDMLVR